MIESGGHLPVVRVVWVAHAGASPDTGKKAEEFMKQLLPANTFVMSDSEPDIILFMSGGSERRAISLIGPGHPVMLLSIRGNNAYAAATEVMAWVLNNNRFAILSDALEALETGLLNRWRHTVIIWKSLSGQRAGLIGSVSEWLVASDVPAERLLRVFNVILEEIPWNTLPDYTQQEPDTSLVNRFRRSDLPGLDEAARVLTLLRQTASVRGLSAIAVECFSLVQQRKVTACLALAQLNTEGMVAACEGDLASLAGMMLMRAATGHIPWMANTTGITGNRLLLSHCTAGFNLVNDVNLVTHYETGLSLAVKGTVTASDVTLFRFSGSLDRAFIAEGMVVSHPVVANACRTQAEIELSSQSVEWLRKHPLGNHLLMVPGKHSEVLTLICRYKYMTVIGDGKF